MKLGMLDPKGKGFWIALSAGLTEIINIIINFIFA